MTSPDITSSEKLSDLAYRTVRDQILRGELRFGELVTRRRLAKALGMSLPPISEALQRLEHEGLVESRPRVGTRVRTPSEMDLRGHCLVREALESQAARLFAVESTPQQRAELLGLAVQLDVLFRQPQPDRPAYEGLHERFHMFVPEALPYPTLREAVEKQVHIWSWLSSRLAWENSVRSLPDEEHPPEHWHERLAEALCSGDPVIADQAMRLHVRRGLEVILEHLRAAPG